MVKCQGHASTASIGTPGTSGSEKSQGTAVATSSKDQAPMDKAYSDLFELIESQKSEIEPIKISDDLAGRLDDVQIDAISRLNDTIARHNQKTGVTSHKEIINMGAVHAFVNMVKAQRLPQTPPPLSQKEVPGTTTEPKSLWTRIKTGIKRALGFPSKKTPKVK